MGEKPQSVNSANGENNGISWGFEPRTSGFQQQRSTRLSNGTFKKVCDEQRMGASNSLLSPYGEYYAWSYSTLSSDGARSNYLRLR